MRAPKNRFIAKLGLLLGCSSSLLINASETQVTETHSTQLGHAEQAFIQRFIQAINTDDLATLKAFSHPDYLACIQDDNQFFYDDQFNKTLQRSIPNNYEATFELLPPEAVSHEIEGATRMGLPYPISPTHRLQIDFNKSEYASVTLVRQLVLDNDHFYLVSGCPTQTMLERYQQLQTKRRESRKRALILFQAIDNDLRQELTLLLKNGQKIQAWKRYSQATGESIGTAKDVLSHIKP